MTTLFVLLPALSAIPLIFEDFRSREVSLLWLIVFAVASIASATVVLGPSMAVENAIPNLLLLLYMAGGIALWVWIKNKRIRKTNPSADTLNTKDYLGLGDVIFFAALTPMCSLREFLLFMLVAFVGSLLWWLSYRLIYRKNTTIPLVGTAGILFCVCLIIRAV